MDDLGGALCEEHVLFGFVLDCGKDYLDPLAGSGDYPVVFLGGVGVLDELETDAF